MSVWCPSCGFESPDGAPWCDFCKEPFGKKPKPAPPPNPLAGLSKEQLLELPAETLLKAEEPPPPSAPPWLRPLTWAMLVIWLALGGLALWSLHSRYSEQHPPAPSGSARPLPNQ